MIKARRACGVGTAEHCLPIIPHLGPLAALLPLLCSVGPDRFRAQPPSLAPCPTAGSQTASLTRYKHPTPPHQPATVRHALPTSYFSLFSSLCPADGSRSLFSSLSHSHHPFVRSSLPRHTLSGCSWVRHYFTYLLVLHLTLLPSTSPLSNIHHALLLQSVSSAPVSLLLNSLSS
ncbi:hypothetical protein IWX90DRAFT_207145 [Phyllosticta citrichinensis]|uniref:Uncharacterized protein n=1 Tax=Phyllosticta citrichinensis TaxID=1130410 RepID=A0ABR1XSK1_9PEZI